jgi:uncharacterized membrane protein required for colicin V production
MNTTDITLLVGLGGFVLYGLWFGVIHMVGAFAGIIIGAVAAGRFYEGVGSWIAPFVNGNVNLAKVIAFVLTFILINRLVGLAFWVVEKIFKIISVIPFLKTFNRLLGAALGLFEGTLVLGLVVYFASRFPVSAVADALLKDSQVAQALYPIGAMLAPLLPQAVRMLQSFM